MPVVKKERFIMNGLKTTSKQALNATANPPPEGDFVWDGKDEDERPLSKEEMSAGIKNKGGRPKSTNPKQAVSIRLSSDVLEYFRGSGKGWQTRLDEVLRKYVSTH